MELELGLAISNCNHFHTNGIKDSFDDSFSDMKMKMKQKRCFEEAFEDKGVVERKTLSLFIWNGQPNEDDDHHGRNKKPFNATCHKDFEEENLKLLGWPPINTWRKKQFHHQGHAGWITNDRNNNNNNIIVGGRNSMYVKVKMEGVPIGRKVDIRLYHSYQLLTQNLLQMFSKYQNSGNNSSRFTILYQDREGDWMLAGDVPWKTFVETVQRIEIQKNEK
ncbi:hypothetical protein R3W88_022863 [Solanum pinnatisectum]|uniref:Auxin-responsive protein n=1 Tax=Solanum pinnatisectum TaxID=50273 RepID=A0AAV9LWT9_9SOLN|nr:hypothetical protein R3W88_022841 [Solanum pinnatisectum]KAK4729875.1 hypothetical protein R3W88_022863 [Solanum pinnatisectum]